MPIRINTQQDSKAFDILPLGSYRSIVTECEILGPGPSGFQYANWEFTVSDGEFKGKKVWTITSFSPKAINRFNELLKALGEKSPTLGTEAYDFDEKKWIGSEATLLLDQESYEDKFKVTQLRNIVSGVLPITRGSGGRQLK